MINSVGGAGLHDEAPERREMPLKDFLRGGDFALRYIVCMARAKKTDEWSKIAKNTPPLLSLFSKGRSIFECV